MTIQMALYLVVLLLLSAVSLSCIFLYRRRTQKLMQKILDRIDNAIAGRYQEANPDESMLSAIEERLNQFLSISIETKKASSNERDTIQSLVSDISHQLKTPLSNMILYTELLQERKDIPDKVAGMANQIHIQSEKLNFLIKALVKSSYLETELISISKRPEKLDELILQSCQAMESKAMGKGISMEYEECGYICSFDPKWTQEALCNILDNAIKYSMPHSTIHIQVMEYEMFCRIDIVDSGMGIPEEEQGLIFQRYYRSPLVKQEQGLGIGLYLAREIIGRQQGFIRVSSKPMSTTNFSIFLCRS